MKKTFFICIFIISSLLIYAQKQDNNLLFGYAGGEESPNDDIFGINLLTFENGSAKFVDNQIIKMSFNDTNVSMSDSIGNLMFYYNGVYIENAEFEPMEGGDTLNVWENLGNDTPQGAVSIPFPGQSGKYILLHETEDYIVAPWWGFQSVALYYSVVDMHENNGRGRVTERKKLLIADTLTFGQLTAVRHANGRDWWVLPGESHTNMFYTLLIDPGGVHLTGKQSEGPARNEGFGHAYFSPDGTKYVSSQGIDFGPNWEYLYVYDFDRCTGLLSNGKEIHLTGNIGSGIAISPNSRFLYTPVEEYLYQFDLQAANVAGSRLKVGTYNGHLDPFPTKFDKCFLAPDGKIYVVTSSGSRTLHIVNNPDELGAACDFRQPGIMLPCYNANSFPNFPNYRLGPEDGASCDTLGINNDPVSWWRYEQDTLNPLGVAFRDLSYHEPDTWSWDFGDGSQQIQERHPNHQFESAGTYEVCLTVSNNFGSDTHCKTLYAGVTATENPVLQNQVIVSPNPFFDRMSIALSTNLVDPVFTLYDSMGRLKRKEHLAFGVTEIEAGNLSSGMYFWEVTSLGEKIKSGKMVKISR